MTSKNYRFTLDVRDAASSVCISARKGDRERRLCVRLTDGGKPYRLPDGCYAVFNAVRASDGKVLIGDCIVAGDVIIYELDAALATAIGRIDCDITLYSAGGEELTSPKFCIMIYAGASTTDEIEGSDEYRTLGELVSEARELRNENVSFADELAELKDGIAVELEEANDTIGKFNTWYEDTAGKLSRLSDTMEQKLGSFEDAAEDALSDFRTDGEKLVTEVVEDTGGAIAKVEQASLNMQQEVSTKMAEFSSVGQYATVPAKNWSDDTDLLTKRARAQRIAYKSSANDLKPIIDHNWGAETDAILSEDWQTFEATFTYAPTDYTGGLWLVFYGGKNETFCHPYDIADVKLWRASDADRTNLFPEDIAKLNWWWHHDTESCLEVNRFSVAFDDDGHKYIHVWRQHTYVSPSGTMNGNMAYLRAGTGVKLTVGETYVLSCRMRTTCAQHTAIVPFDGIRAASSTAVVPCVSSASAAIKNGVRAFGQRIGELMFRADTVPSSDMLFGVTAVKGEGGVILNVASSRKNDELSVLTGSYVGGNGGLAEISFDIKWDGYNSRYYLDSVGVADVNVRTVELPFAPRGMLICFGSEVRAITSSSEVIHNFRINEIYNDSGRIIFTDGPVDVAVQSVRIVENRLEFIGNVRFTGTEDGTNVGVDVDYRLDDVNRAPLTFDDELNQAGVTYHYLIW